MRGIRDAGFVTSHRRSRRPRCRWRSRGKDVAGPVADGHRQDRRLPDRRLHPLSRAPRLRPRSGATAPARAHHRAHARAGGPDRGRRAAPRRATPGFGSWPSTAASTTTSSARRSARLRRAGRHARPPHRLPEAARLVAEPCRGARHRRGRPHVRHGLHRRPALHPAPAAQAGAAAVVPLLGHALLPGAGADLGVHEQPDPDHHHAHSRRPWRRPSRCSTTSAARRSSTCSSGLLQARGRQPHPHLLQHARGGPAPRGPPQAQRLAGAGAHRRRGPEEAAQDPERLQGRRAAGPGRHRRARRAACTSRA